MRKLIIVTACLFAAPLVAEERPPFTPKPGAGEIIGWVTEGCAAYPVYAEPVARQAPHSIPSKTERVAAKDAKKSR